MSIQIEARGAGGTHQDGTVDHCAVRRARGGALDVHVSPAPSIYVVRARCYRATSTTHTSILHITFTYTRFAFSRVRASPHVRCGCITMCPYSCAALPPPRRARTLSRRYGFTVRPNSSIYEVVKRCPFGVLVQCLAVASRTSTSAHIKPNDPDAHSMSPSRPMQLVVQPGAGARSFL